MRKNKLFKFDFISLFAIFSFIVLAFCVDSLIELKYNSSSSEKDILYGWIRVVSSILLSITAVVNLRNKRNSGDEILNK